MTPAASGAVFADLFSRRVLAWSMMPERDASLALDALTITFAGLLDPVAQPRLFGTVARLTCHVITWT